MIDLTARGFSRRDAVRALVSALRDRLTPRGAREAVPDPLPIPPPPAAPAPPTASDKFIVDIPIAKGRVEVKVFVFAAPASERDVRRAGFKLVHPTGAGGAVAFRIWWHPAKR